MSPEECSHAHVELDEQRRELFCIDCGLVLGEKRIDDSPPTGEEAIKREPTKDKIWPQTKFGSTDHAGVPVDPQTRAKLTQTATIHARTWSEKDLQRLYGYIDRLASSLSLPHDFADRAKYVCRQVRDRKLISRASWPDLASATILIACRERHRRLGLLDLPFDKLTNRDIVRHYFYEIVRELGLKPEPIAMTASYISEFVSDLALGFVIVREAVQVVKGRNLGGQPRAIAAGAIWLVAQKLGLALRQCEIAEVSGVSANTIKKWADQLASPSKP